MDHRHRTRSPGPQQDDADHHQHHHHQHAQADEAGLAEVLDLDGEVMHAYLDEVVSWVAAATGPDVRRVVDLGAGTGTGTLALAHRFPAARVEAVDLSDTMLGRLRAAAAAAGVADRVRTTRVDLDAGWTGEAGLDLVWSALALHHVADPGQLLVRAHDALRPGGLLALTEMATPTRFLPDELGLGRPGLESRLHAAVDAQPASFDRYPDWDEVLERAGFVEVRRRSFSVTPPAPELATGRLARAYLGRLRAALAETLDGDDLATLDRLLDDTSPHGLLRRGDLQVQGLRTGWMARRP